MATPTYGENLANARATGWGSNVAGYQKAFASGGWAGAINSAPGTGQASAGYGGTAGSAPVSSGGGGASYGGVSSHPANSIAWPTTIQGPNAGVNNNNLFSGGGYAYVDKYGIPHVVNDLATAQQYAKVGTPISPYSGTYSGGYASDMQGNRQWLSLPGAQQLGGASNPFGNFGSEAMGNMSLVGNPLSATTPASSPTSLPSNATWQDKLSYYSNPANAAAAQAEIARAQAVYNRQSAAGNTSGAQAAHNWANQIRQAMGLLPGVNYDPTTGAAIGTGVTNPSTGVTNPSATAPAGYMTQAQADAQAAAQLAAYKQQQQQGVAGVFSQYQTQQSSFPYEQLLTQLEAQPSAYQMPSPADLQGQAQTYAATQVDPILTAIQNQLTQEQQAYNSAVGQQQAAYSQVGAQTQAGLKQAQQDAMQSAIARGMGQSGVVDWETQKLSQPLLLGEQQSQQPLAAALAGLSNTWAGQQATAANQTTAAQTQLGNLQSNEYQSLYQQAMANAQAAQQAQYQGAVQLAELAQSGNQQNFANELQALQSYLYG
jgi:hypothetical protein